MTTSVDPAAAPSREQRARGASGAESRVSTEIVRSPADVTVEGGVSRAPATYVRDFEDVDVELGAVQPAWARALRRTALERFQAFGFPTTKNEDWHFTSVARIAESDFLTLTAPGGEVTYFTEPLQLFTAAPRAYAEGEYLPFVQSDPPPPAIHVAAGLPPLDRERAQWFGPPRTAAEDVGAGDGAPAVEGQP